MKFCSNDYEVDQLKDINHIHIRSWVVSLVNDGITQSSVNRKISALRSFYKWLLKKEVVTINPMIKIMAPKIPKRLPVVVQDINIDRLLEKPLIIHDDDFSVYEMARDHFIIELFYMTGMRRAELISLEVKDVDVNRQEIRVTGKGNKVRIIPLTEATIQDFKSYCSKREKITETSDIHTDALFLTAKGNPIYPRLVHNIVHRQLSDITTLEKRSPHVLRHSFATHLLDRGADINGIKELLGHANLAATEVYTHNSIAKLKDVYKKAHPRK